MRSPALLDHDLHVIHTETAQPAAVALIAGALSEAAARAGADAIADFAGPYRSDFDPWLGGAVVVLAEHGKTVAGGALRRYDSNTAEIDWLWTRPDRRRRGLARRVLRELEEAALWRHYRRLYAVTGPGRAEARALLHSSGYRPLGAGICASAAAQLAYLGFVKALG
jgi:polar amino acid transport system permease protein